MIFYVKTVTGMQIARFDMAGDTLLRDVKRAIERKNGIPVDEQRLIYRGRDLEKERTLDDYNVLDNAILHFISRLQGG
jgi:ubiquitin C